MLPFVSPSRVLQHPESHRRSHPSTVIFNAKAQSPICNQKRKQATANCTRTYPHQSVGVAFLESKRAIENMGLVSDLTLHGEIGQEIMAFPDIRVSPLWAFKGPPWTERRALIFPRNCSGWIKGRLKRGFGGRLKLDWE